MIFQTESYQVETPVFHGPMDLLLQLIESAELDITRIALAQVTDQFLIHLRALEDKAVEEISGFLVVAVRLLQIKSEALLPRPPDRLPGEEDPGEEFARQLIAYKRYKEIARSLAERDQRGLRTYLRLAAPPKVVPTIDWSGIGFSDFLAAARRALIRNEAPADIGRVVVRPRLTIRQSIQGILDRIRSAGRTRFFEIIRNLRRVDVVVSFLAILELIKRRRVNVAQADLFGDIAIEPTETWDDEQDFDLEFVE